MGDLVSIRGPGASLPPRGEGGQFVATRPPGELMRLLREVGEAAVAKWPGAIEDPRRLSQQVWDAARIDLENRHGTIPHAASICRSLGESTDRRLSWEGWLALAFSPEDPARVLSQLLAEPSRQLNPGDIVLALRIVARRADCQTLSVPEYDRIRRELLRSAAASGRGETGLRRMLPTSDQIITASGNWRAACALAGVEGPTRGEGAVCVEQAIACFFARRGHLPSRRQLEAFAAQEQLSVAKPPPWTEAVAAGVRAIRAHPALPEPPPYGAPPPAAWEPISIDQRLPKRRPRRYTAVERVDALRRFVRWCAEAGRSPSDAAYREWSRGKPVPQLNAVRRAGKASVAEQVARLATEQDWQGAALAADALASEGLRADREERSRRRRAASPTTRRILSLLRAGQTLSAREIAKALEWNIYKARRNLGSLTNDGLIDRIHHPTTGRREGYRLPPRANADPSSKMEVEDGATTSSASARHLRSEPDGSP
ncbi:MAG: winged helix-turn-helix domain-containing protein [Thermoleophilia bacterium]